MCIGFKWEISNSINSLHCYSELRDNEVENKLIQEDKKLMSSFFYISELSPMRNSLISILTFKQIIQ